MEHTYLDVVDKDTLLDGVLRRLEPWLDYELWSKIDERKKATRVNVAYEEQRQAMLEGTWQVEPTDEGAPAASHVDDLDIVREVD